MSAILKIHHIDVGQGDSTLIVVKEGQNKKTSGSKILNAVLIDAGVGAVVGNRIVTYMRQKLNHWPAGYKKISRDMLLEISGCTQININSLITALKDARCIGDISGGTYPVENYIFTGTVDGINTDDIKIALKKAYAGQVKTLDAIICTHYDADHWGGLPTVFDSEFYDPIKTSIYDQGQWCDSSTLMTPSGYSDSIYRQYRKNFLSELLTEEKLNELGIDISKKDYLVKYIVKLRYKPNMKEMSFWQSGCYALKEKTLVDFQNLIQRYLDLEDAGSDHGRKRKKNFLTTTQRKIVKSFLSKMSLMAKDGTKGNEVSQAVITFLRSKCHVSCSILMDNWKTREDRGTNWLLKESAGNGSPTNGEIYNANNINIKCIAANLYVINNLDTVTEKPKSRSHKKNNRSLAFLIQYNKFYYYTGGDIGKAQEKAIAAYFNNKKFNEKKEKVSLSPKPFEVDSPMQAFKSSHHGSDLTSTPTELVETAKNPSVAFISFGFGDFDHPDFPVFKRLQDEPSIKKIYLTGNVDKNGHSGLESLVEYLSLRIFKKEEFNDLVDGKTGEEITELLENHGYFSQKKEYQAQEAYKELSPTKKKRVFLTGDVNNSSLDDLMSSYVLKQINSFDVVKNTDIVDIVGEIDDPRVTVSVIIDRLVPEFLKLKIRASKEYIVKQKFLNLVDSAEMDLGALEESKVTKVYEKIKKDLISSFGYDSKKNVRVVVPGNPVLTIDEAFSNNGNLKVNYDRLLYEKGIKFSKNDFYEMFGKRYRDKFQSYGERLIVCGVGQIFQKIDALSGTMLKVNISNVIITNSCFMDTTPVKEKLATGLDDSYNDTAANKLIIKKQVVKNVLGKINDEYPQLILVNDEQAESIVKVIEANLAIDENPSKVRLDMFDEVIQKITDVISPLD